MEKNPLPEPPGDDSEYWQTDEAREAALNSIHEGSGLPLDAEPAGMGMPPPRFVEALEKVLHRLKINTSPVAEILLEKWNAILPPELAGKCRPGKFQKETFYVYVPDSPTLFELRRSLPQIKAAVCKAATGARIRDVRLVLDPDRNPFEAGGRP